MRSGFVTGFAAIIALVFAPGVLAQSGGQAGGRAIHHTGGAVVVYDAPSATNLRQMTMPPVSQAYLNSQSVPTLPTLGPGQPAQAVSARPQPSWPVATPRQRNWPVAPATAWPVAGNPSLGAPTGYPYAANAQYGAARQPAAPAIDISKDPYVDGTYIFKKDYLFSWPKNVWQIVSAPARFDQNDWLVAGSILGVTGALFLLDKEIRNFVQGDIRSSGTDDFFDAVEPLGDFDYMLAGSMGAYAISELFGAKREKATSLLLFQTVAIAGGLGEGFKRLTGRTRPEGTRANPDPDTLDFKGFDSGDNDSFPSGHAIVAFATATVLSETYALTSPWVPWVTYPLATSVALARIHENRHWASDVFLGGAFGHFVAKLIVANNPFLRKHNMMIRPLDVQNGRGAAISLKY